MRVVFGLGGEGERKLVDPAIFSPDPRQLYHPKLRKKHKGKTSHSYSDKIAPSQHQRSTLCLLSFLLPPLFFILCSPVSSYLSFGTLPPIFFFIFLFLYMIFIFNTFGWLPSFFFFFSCLSLFCFNLPSFFNNDIWVNLYKLTFTIHSLFYSQPNKKEGN